VDSARPVPKLETRERFCFRESRIRSNTEGTETRRATETDRRGGGFPGTDIRCYSSCPPLRISSKIGLRVSPCLRVSVNSVLLRRTARRTCLWRPGMVNWGPSSELVRITVTDCSAQRPMRPLFGSGFFVAADWLDRTLLPRPACLPAAPLIDKLRSWKGYQTG
jgi:hypothetical protein